MHSTEVEYDISKIDFMNVILFNDKKKISPFISLKICNKLCGCKKDSLIQNPNSSSADVLNLTMLFLKIFTCLVAIGYVNCDVNIKLGDEIDYGYWDTKHWFSAPLKVEGKHYFYGLSYESYNTTNWFIREIEKDGKIGNLTDQGRSSIVYTKAFPLSMSAFNGPGTCVYAISSENNWIVYEILSNGTKGFARTGGSWKSTPSIIFPFKIPNQQYVYTQIDNDWFINKLNGDGRPEISDSGAWNHSHTQGFPFSIQGRQFFYSVSNDKHWFIRELLVDGKMGLETDNGTWSAEHSRYVPFSIGGRNYFYGLVDNPDMKFWFMKELLPGGKMSTEKIQDVWQDYYDLSFFYNIDGRQYFYGFKDYAWSIQKITSESKFPIPTTK